MHQGKSPDAKLTDIQSNKINEKDKRSRLSFSKLTMILLLICIYTGAYFGVLLFGSNQYMVLSTVGDIDTSIEKEYDAIIVLGAGVRTDGSMSDMLRDRMDRAIELYFEGVSGKLLVTGDHGRENYDEVNTMKQYAIECGVPSSDVFMDHAGFSTYESIVRASEIFSVDSAVIVTQRYHLYRAMYIADYVGIECVGASADLHTYRGQSYRDVREALARLNDSLRGYTRPAPTYLGEVIDISGDGDQTNDK